MDTEREIETESLSRTVLRTGVVSLAEAAAFPLAMILFAQLQDPSSWLRLRIEETKDVIHEAWIAYYVERITKGGNEQ